MTLSYKNLGKDEILNQLRDIRFANGEMLFGQYNTVSIDFDFIVDVQQISIQADVFAREMITHRSDFDFKRFLGQYQIDWLRILHEAYVFDRCRAIYYGMNSINMLSTPNDIKSFTGHVLLFNMLSKMNFKFTTADEQPYQIYANVKYPGDALTLLEPIFKAYPNVKEGISDNPRYISYVNQTYDAVLEGLYNGSMYLNSRNNSSFFSIKSLDDETIANVLSDTSNPILNSFLSKDGRKFYFIHPSNVSGPGKMKFNESIFINRALGFRSNQLNVDENTFYKVAKRDAIRDVLTKEEVYAITGLKTEIIPYSTAQTNEYLGFNSYKSVNSDGNTTSVIPEEEDELPL